MRSLIGFRMSAKAAASNLPNPLEEQISSKMSLLLQKTSCRSPYNLTSTPAALILILQRTGDQNATLTVTAFLLTFLFRVPFASTVTVLSGYDSTVMALSHVAKYCLNATGVKAAILLEKDLQISREILRRKIDLSGQRPGIVGNKGNWRPAHLPMVGCMSKSASLLLAGKDVTKYISRSGTPMCVHRSSQGLYLVQWSYLKTLTMAFRISTCVQCSLLFRKTICHLHYLELCAFRAGITTY